MVCVRALARVMVIGDDRDNRTWSAEPSFSSRKSVSPFVASQLPICQIWIRWMQNLER